ncbi:hypothetical protein [Catenuloplanes atrovinosus]|uniref:Uncharacterized protein n=1 Tax=Catenuloplanes atrovinosus TaxID=137266 RepID=A0AAE3YSF5_9ACTN|nr:hypothetical protein [Catenuloplanes atrovinosus]MDR7278377.1 hypothetical protein [Catenuloplanes atrovinosus]
MIVVGSEPDGSIARWMRASVRVQLSLPPGADDDQTQVWISTGLKYEELTTTSARLTERQWDDLVARVGAEFDKHDGTGEPLREFTGYKAPAIHSEAGGTAKPNPPQSGGGVVRPTRGT